MRKVLIFLFIVLSYFSGVLFRFHQGIKVVVVNESGQELHDLGVKVETAGPRFGIPDLRRNRKATVYLRSTRKSHINLEFADESGNRIVRPIIFYAAGGECGSVSVTVRPGGGVDTPGVLNASCWKGWFDFN